LSGPGPGADRGAARPPARGRIAQPRSAGPTRAILAGTARGSRPGWLAHPMDPAEGVRAATALQVDQLIAQRHGHLARYAVSDRELATRPAHLAHRGEHGRRAAGEDLPQPAARRVRTPLFERDRALLDRAALVPGERDHRVTGDAGQDRTGQLRRD